MPKGPAGGVRSPGHPHCGLRLKTVEEFRRHLLGDALRGIVDLIIRRRRLAGMDYESRGGVLSAGSLD